MDGDSYRQLRQAIVAAGWVYSTQMDGWALHAHHPSPPAVDLSGYNERMRRGGNYGWVLPADEAKAVYAIRAVWRAGGRWRNAPVISSLTIIEGHEYRQRERGATLRQTLAFIAEHPLAGPPRPRETPQELHGYRLGIALRSRSLPSPTLHAVVESVLASSGWATLCSGAEATLAPSAGPIHRVCLAAVRRLRDEQADNTELDTRCDTC